MGEVNTITVDVIPGDTLESIAQKYGVTVDALEAHDPATIGRWLVSDDFRPLQIQVPQAPNGQTLEVMRDNSGRPTHVVAISPNEANRDEQESSQSDTTSSQDTTVNNPTQATQSTQSLASVVRRVNSIINQQIEQAVAQAEAQIEERYLESLPGLWSMQSRDDLLRYFWVQRGNSLESYNQSDAQRLVIESSWQYAHELGTQLDNFSELTPDQQQYLTMLQSINPPPLYETGRETLLAHYQSEYAQLFSEQGMDTFFQMFSDSQGIAEGGAFISPEFWQFAEAYQYVSVLEDGATLPFTPTFDPDFATRTLLATKGWTFGFGEQGMEDVLIAQELMYMLGESLARQETEGVTFYSDVSTDYMPALYAMLSQQYGADFTADDMVQFVNNLSVVLQNDNIPGDARLSLQETQMYSDLYLTGREMDEDRQLAQGWDTVQQQKTQDLLGKLEANVGKIQALDGEILGVSTSGVKGAFANLLKTSSDYVDHLKNIKTQMPGMEDNLVSIQEATEAEKEMMDQIMTMALLLPVGLASETADTGISLLEFLATGDPLAGLGILPILPNQSDEIIDYARDARLLGALDGILPYMDEVSEATRYGFDTADEILESLEFYRGFDMRMRAFDPAGLVMDLIDFMPRGNAPGRRFAGEFAQTQIDLMAEQGLQVIRNVDPSTLRDRSAGFDFSDPDNLKILLQKDSTIYEYYHELAHYDHHQLIGHDAYSELSRPMPVLDAHGNPRLNDDGSPVVIRPGDFIKELTVYKNLRSGGIYGEVPYINQDQINHAGRVITEELRRTLLINARTPRGGAPMAQVQVSMDQSIATTMHWIRHYEEALDIEFGLDENEIRVLIQAAYSAPPRR